MSTNLLANGGIAPTYPGVNAHFNAVVEPGAVTLSGRGQVAFTIAPGMIEAGKEYQVGGFSIADLLPGTIVRVRTGMTTSGSGATSDSRITSEGPSGPLPFQADGNENNVLFTLEAADDTVAAIGAKIVGEVVLAD